MSLKPTMSKDGYPRATMRVDFRVDLNYATLAVIEDDVSKITRASVEKAVRESLFGWGMEMYTRAERLEDTHIPEDHDEMEWEDYYNHVQQQIIEVYPEFKV